MGKYIEDLVESFKLEVRQSLRIMISPKFNLSGNYLVERKDTPGAKMGRRAYCFGVLAGTTGAAAYLLKHV